MVTLRLDNGDMVETASLGILESALAECKRRQLGGTILRDGQVIGYVHRTATAGGGWSAYLTERGQE